MIPKETSHANLHSHHPIHHRWTQIDVVGSRDHRWIDIGECNWGTVASLRRRYPNTRGSTLGRRLFGNAVRRRRKALPQHVRVHTVASETPLRRRPQYASILTRRSSVQFQHHFDRAIDAGLVDVTHRLRVGGDRLLDRGIVRQHLRRHSQSGELDARPDGLHLRRIA